MIASTSDGGASWQETTAPRSWPDIPTAISCAAGLDCFIAAADYTQSASYYHPAIEATYDGGRAWSTISLPTGPGSPLALVWPLSCPSQAGCIGLAATVKGFGSGADQRLVISSLPAPGQPAAAG